jgi:hypothetical protein
MMVGLCAIGASAAHFDDYADKAVVKHKEAVKLLTELGVLEGDEGGFRPNDTLTRDEAAKLVVALQNINPTGLTSTFTDVDAWAQPYVGWLQSQKIVEGIGGGLYNPKATLKFVDFAAMLLRTLGYDKDRELMTGKTYELGVLKLVNKLNLAHGIRGWEYDQPITRDDAAQLAFNALRENMVDYKGSALANASIDENGNFVPGLRDEIPNTAFSFVSADGKKYPGGDDAEQMIERFWPKVKVWHDYDAFGVPVDKWFTGVDTVDYKYTDAKEICTIERVGVMAEYTTTAGTVLLSQVYADGNLTEPTTLRVKENGQWLADGITVAKNTAKPLGYGGATVLLIDYDSDDMADCLIVKYPYLGIVTDVIPAADSDSGDREIELTIFNGAKPVSGVTFATESFSKYDYVLVYPSNSIETTKAYTKAEDFTKDLSHWVTYQGEQQWVDDVHYIIMVAPAESLSGKLTRTGMAQGKAVSMTVAGESHNIGTKLGFMGITATFQLNKTATLYMNNGYVLGVTGERPSYNYYVFKINDGYSSSTDVTLPGYDATDKFSKVGAVKQDGTTVIYNAVTADVPADYGWFAPTTSSTGMTTFAAPSGAASEVDSYTTKIGPKIAFFGRSDDGYSVNADAKTEFVLYTNAGYKHYTGVANLPSYEYTGDPEALQDMGGKVYALVVDNMAVAVFIDIRGEGWELKGAPQAGIFLLNSSYSGAEYDEELGKVIYTYSGIVDGKFGTFKSSNADLATALSLKDGQQAVLFTPKVAGGLVTGGTVIKSEGVGTVTVSNGTFIVNLDDGDQVGYITTDKTTVFFFDANTGKRIEAGNAADINGKYGEITVEYATDGTVDTIYVYTPYLLK